MPLRRAFARFVLFPGGCLCRRRVDALGAREDMRVPAPHLVVDGADDISEIE